MLDQIVNAKVFSKIYLKGGYHQIQIGLAMSGKQC